MKRTRGLLVISLVLAIALYMGIYKRHEMRVEKKVSDRTSEMNEIKEIIRRELVKAGVADTDIIKWVYEEKENGESKWIQFTAEVLAGKDVSFSQLESEIRSSLAWVGAEILAPEESETKDEMAIAAGKNGITFAALRVKRKPGGKYRVAIIIDDVGNRRDLLKDYIALGVHLNYAILPYSPYSAILARELKNSGNTVLLHLPCEPKEYPKLDPGKGAVLVSMKPSQIKEAILGGMDSVPGLEGVSNHEGSRAMSDEKTVKYMMQVLKEKNLPFIDSKTSPDTLGAKIAKQEGVRCVSNDVFLDNEDDDEYVAGRLERLKVIVKQKGCAVAIGHISRKSTPRVLAQYIPKFRAEGIEFVGVSELLGN